MATNKEIATLIAKLTLDSSEFTSGINKATNPLKSFSNGMKSAGNTVSGGLKTISSAISGVHKVGSKTLSVVGTGVAAAAAGVTALATSSVKAYADYEQLVGGINTLFGTGGKSIQEYAALTGKSLGEVSGEFSAMQAVQRTVLNNANAAYKTAGLSANDYMESVTSFSAGLLQSLNGDTAAAAKIADMAIIDMSDNANKMGTSMEMIQNAYQGFAKQNYTMLDNLKLGYGGTKGEMQRLLEDAEKLSGTKYDISNLNEVFTAIHVIQKEIGFMGTTALEAESTIRGSASAMKSAWENMLVGMAGGGEDFGTLVDNLVGSVGTFAKNLLPRIEIVLAGLSDLILKLAPLLFDSLLNLIAIFAPKMLEMGVELIQYLVDGIKSNLSAITQSASLIMNGLHDGIIGLLPSLMEIAPELIGAFAEGFLLYQSLVMTIGLSVITALATGIRDNLPTLIPLAAELLTNFVTMLSESLPVIATAAIDIILALGNGLVDNLPTLAPLIALMFDGLLDIFIENAPLIIGLAVQIITTLGQGLADNLPVLVPKIVELVTSIGTAIGDNLPLLWDAGMSIIAGLLEGLWKAFPDIISGIGDILDSFIKSVLEILGIKSPSTVFAGIGDNIIQGLLNGMKDTWALVVTWATGLANIIIGWFSSIDLLQTGRDIIDGIKRGFEEAWEGVVTWFEGAWGRVKDLFKMPDEIKLFGKTIYGGKKNESSGESNDTGMVDVESMLAIDPITGIPQAVIDSFGALNTEIGSLNTSIGTLNSSLGNGEGGLSFLLSGLDLYISTVFTEALRNFGTFISPDGELGLAITKLAQLFSMEGSTTALKQVLMSIKDYLELDLTTAFTNFGTFISPEGAFGLSVTGLAKSLFDEGSETSLYSAFKKIADYVGGEFTTKMTDFDTLLSTKLKPTYETLAELLYYGNNTVHNAYGAVQGVLESIYEILYKIIERLNGSFTDALVRSLTPMANFEAAARQVAQACSAIASWAGAAIGQLEALIALMHDLQVLETATSMPKQKFSKKEAQEAAKELQLDTHADGGRVYKGIPSIVGERGPEIFTPKRSGWIIPNDEAFGGHGNKQPINIEIHDIYGDANLEQRIRNGITLGLREAEFHGIGA